MNNSTKAFDVFKKILKWFFIILGVIQFIQIVFSLLFFGVIKLPFSTVHDAPAKEQFYVSGFSPDSKMLYMEFADTARNVRIGRMDLSTQKVSLFVPQDTQNQLASPRSSADGKQLAIVIKEAVNNFETSQIGVLDLDSNTYRAITRSNTYKQFPSFSKDGKKIIYAQSNRIRESGKTRFSEWDIYETEVNTGTERRLTSFCFFAVSDPFYLNEGEKFVFSGEPSFCNYPVKGRAQDGTDNRRNYLTQYQGNIIFMMGGDETRLKPFLMNGADSHGSILTRDGKIFFVSRTNEMDGIKCCNYNYDIFVYESGVIKRLTNLKTLLTGLVVSPRGDLAAYISDPLRNRSRENWMMDVNNGTHSQINIGDSKSFQVINLVKQLNGENK